MDDNREKVPSAEEKVSVEANDYDFIREKIKERPINRKRLVRRLLFTVGTAVLFGIVACVTFLWLEPLISRMMSSDQGMEPARLELSEGEDNGDYPEEKIKPTEEYSDVPVILEVEKPIEELPLDDKDLEDGRSSVSSASASPSPQVTPAAQSLSLADYRMLSRRMLSLSSEVEKSLVTLSAVPEGTELFSDAEKEMYSTCGFIAGENRFGMLIFADSEKLEDADEIVAGFSTGESAKGVRLLRKDEATGLAVYCMNRVSVPEKAKTECVPAVIGASYSAAVKGNAVIACGMPAGLNSVCYGFVTSADKREVFSDMSLQLLATDIYSSENAGGVLTNLSGQVVGIITADHHDEGREHLIYAWGISSIKGMIEDLSNCTDRSYVGIYPVTVKKTEASEDIPEGVAVTDVDIDSPAMQAGLLRGDVITKAGGSEIRSVDDYMKILRTCSPGDVLDIEFKRLGGEAYADMAVSLETGIRKEDEEAEQ
ncbi:MAG: S1C family serine protease [Lachnospiraceae bacterium]|nr:S1C family serine protease [Lachnospiraceae bacterium]